MVEVAFPYRLDARGATAGADEDAHVEQMVELLLLTRPGERVNLPAFGCGLLDMVFAPNSPEIAAALDVTIAAAVNLWLGDVIALSSLEVTSVESELHVQLAYTVLATGTAATMTLAIPGAP